MDIIRKNTENDTPPFFTETAGQWFSEFQPVTATEVLKLLQSSANKLSPLDPLPTWLFKKIGVDVAPLLVKIFNRSCTKGYAPIRLKMAVVSPLIKKEGLDVDDLTNFRPISNVSLVSKVLERLVCHRMNTHLQNIGTLPPVQSAYRRY